MTQIVSEGKLLLCVPEAAQILSLGRSSVYELIAQGELPTVKIGRAVRIPYAALETWVEKNTTQQGNAKNG